MLHDGGYMGGMHGGWWIFLLLVIGAVLFHAWQRPGRRGDARAEKPQDNPLELLRRRSLPSSTKSTRPCSTVTPEMRFPC